MKTEAQKNSFIARGRKLAAMMEEFTLLSDEYAATDAGNVITDEDFTGINEGLGAADMVAFQGSIINTVNTALDGVSYKTIIENYKSV